MSFFDFPIYQPAQDQLPSEDLTIPHALITIYVNENEYAAGEQGLLSKIIGATGNSLEGVTVQKLGSADFIHAQRSWEKQKGLDIIFGVEKAQLLLQCEVHPYYPIQIGHRTLLFCDALTTLKTDGEKKKALWGCLKTYFEI